MERPKRIRTRLSLVPLLGVGLLFGCARLPIAAAPASHRYFSPPTADDPWSPKIARWQERELAAGGAEVLSAPSTVASGPDTLVSGGGEPLRSKYLRFHAERKRSTARDLASWIQQQSKVHYIPDGVIDRWATLESTLERDGDDCDGLELLSFHLLRELGFRDDEVFRAIVMRPSDGQHHMVTLWFEEPGDPWVIDPTGAMTTGMPRMSEVPSWVPIKLFSETEEFSVRSLPGAGSSLLASSPLRR
jgi:hypothetical protein